MESKYTKKIILKEVIKRRETLVTETLLVKKGKIMMLLINKKWRKKQLLLVDFLIQMSINLQDHFLLRDKDFQTSLNLKIN
jgi:hypothetical protein